MASRSLGSLTLDLIARTGMFERGMDKAARVSEKRMKEIERSATKLGKDLAKSFAAIATTVGAAVGLYIKNTIDFQNEQAQLAAVLKSTGNAAGFSAKELDKMSVAMAKQSTFSGGEITRAQVRLLSYSGVVGEVFPRAMQIVIDQSARLGMSVEQSAETIGRALESPTKAAAALARQGFGAAFTDSVKDAIKALEDAGKMAEAQAIVMEILEESYGGAAEAARNTLGGALSGLKNAFNDLMTGSGGNLNGAVDKINDLTDALGDPNLKAGLDALVNGLLRAANAAVTGAAKLGEFISKYKEFLANSGFVPGDELNQLEARRTKLEESKNKALGVFMRGKIDEEIARVDAQIANFGRKRWQGSDFQDMAPAEWRAKPHTGGGGGGKAKKTGKSDAEKEAEALARAYQSMNERLQEQEFMLGKTGEAARIRYEIELGSLQALAPAMKEQLLARAEAYDLLVAEREEEEKSLKRAQEETAAIKRGIEDTQQLIEDMEFELALIGMTNRERERAIALRHADAHATDEQRQNILALADALHEARKANELWMEFQGSLADAFVDLATGAKSLKDVLTDFFDSIAQAITRSIAESWAETITGWFKGASSGGGGGGGSWWQGLLQSFFGGGKASGGSVKGGMLYEVNEQGTEMFSAGGRDYLLAGTDGNITPAHKLGGGSFVQNVQFLLPERASPSTQSQIAQRTGIATQTAARRNG